MLAELARAWRDERERVLRVGATTILERLRAATGAGRRARSIARRWPGRRRSTAGIGAFAQAFDARRGGFGGAPKFPRPSELLFLFERARGDRRPARGRWRSTRCARWRSAACAITSAAGSIATRWTPNGACRTSRRCSTTRRSSCWRTSKRAQASGEAFYATVAEDTLDYVVRDLTAPDGAFYSAEDADSIVPEGHGPKAKGQARLGSDPGQAQGHEKREGAFYVWTAAEIDRLLGDDAPIVRRRFGIEDDGNAPSDPQGEFRGQNILYVAQSIEDVAARSGPDARGGHAGARRARERRCSTRVARGRVRTSTTKSSRPGTA